MSSVESKEELATLLVIREKNVARLEADDIG